MVRPLPACADDVRPPALVLTLLVATVVVGNRALWKSLDGVGGGQGAVFPFWLPQFGSLGRTVTFYAMVFDFATYVVIPGTLFWLGYALGR
ncbi:hypothetical protein OB920_03330 [Halobacteria archaeon HArc-gm2]|nr:hypothetical protein [Halobacteria archaeon HArc-gm2]